MKYNQIILALVLFASVTAVQTAQAGVWEWVNPFRLVTYVARTAWNHLCPITKHGLAELENEEKTQTTAEIEKILEREKQSKAAINQNFKEINGKHEGLEQLARGIADQSKLLQHEITSLAQELQDLKDKHAYEMPAVQQHADALAKKYTAVLVLMGQVKQQVEQNAQTAQSLEEQLKAANSTMGEVNNNIAQVKQQAGKQIKKNLRIRDMAKEMIQRTALMQKQLINTTQFQLGSVSKNKQ